MAFATRNGIVGVGTIFSNVTVKLAFKVYQALQSKLSQYQQNQKSHEQTRHAFQLLYLIMYGLFFRRTTGSQLFRGPVLQSQIGVFEGGPLHRQLLRRLQRPLLRQTVELARQGEGGVQEGLEPARPVHCHVLRPGQSMRRAGEQSRQASGPVRQ